MSFLKYMHIEKWGNDEVQGIELGETYVFPKLDGTNASLWLEEQGLCGGSRNRQVFLENDNQGFFDAQFETTTYKRWWEFFKLHPKLRLYGEWLVPHTLKTYREDCWRKFYVFDVYNDDTNQYLSYNAYKPMLDECGIEYVSPLAIIRNGTYENFIHVLGQNNFYIKDGEGNGEGIVIKNYDYYNRFGNQVWAKIITSEFKEAHHKEMGAPEREGKLIEETIVDSFVTSAEVNKTIAKIASAEARSWTSRDIPRLLETVYYDLVHESIWEALKQHKNPTINFQTLKHFSIKKVKELAPELF